MVHDDGGDSQEMLQSLVGHAPIAMLGSRHEDFIDDIISNLKTYGPGLVSSFAIDDSMSSFRQPASEYVIPFFDKYVELGGETLACDGSCWISCQ